MKIGIVTDSHSGMSPEEAGKLGVRVLPMPFYFGDECYYEGESLTRDAFFHRLSEGESVTTSQASPESVMDFWRKALEEFDQILYMPISSGLSGACHIASMLAEEEEFKGKVYVVDNGRISTPMHRSILDAFELIGEGYSAANIKEILEANKDKMTIYIAVETLEYLKKGGRITAATAALGSLLNIKPILRLHIGVLDMYRKCRGMKKARSEMLIAMKYDIETKFNEYYERGD
ncbi:MAG: DegV family protein, partial [Lachnospiraceae bacterium]|nr:DegV family protein [Lachnospiraceae bacterium]